MRSHGRPSLLASTSFFLLLLGAAFTIAPIGCDPAGPGLVISSAFAKGGNAGGNGNGNASGNGHAHSGRGTADASVSDTDTESVPFDPPPDGNLSSSLGALNAAHASPSGLTHAAPNSRAGRIETYKEVVLAERTIDQNPNSQQAAAAEAYLESLGLGRNQGVTEEGAEQTALKGAANKPVTDQIMDAVNDLLGL
jgi:hypothetical protein